MPAICGSLISVKDHQDVVTHIQFGSEAMYSENAKGVQKLNHI